MSAARRWLLAAALMLLGGIAVAQTRPAAPGAAPAAGTPGVAGPAVAPATARAIFAGGCFWCVEADFDKVPGVLATVSGYTGGTVPNPTYEQVSRKGTGHTEAVEITFDPARVSYAQLVEYFWRTIDPTVRDRQFCDVGSPYRTAIFALDEEQLRIARASLAALEKSRPFKEPVVTPVQPAAPFYPAEDYHQDYFANNPFQPYCQAVAGPKVAKVRKVFKELVKEQP